MLNIVWKNDTSKYGNGEIAFVGKIKIGSYGWNSVTSTPRYKTYFFQDGFMAEKGADTPEKCKEIVEQSFLKFANALGVKSQPPAIEDVVKSLKEIEAICLDAKEKKNDTFITNAILLSVQTSLKTSNEKQKA